MKKLSIIITAILLFALPVWAFPPSPPSSSSTDSRLPDAGAQYGMLSSNGTAWARFDTSADVYGFLQAANYAAMRVLLGFPSAICDTGKALISNGTSLECSANAAVTYNASAVGPLCRDSDGHIENCGTVTDVNYYKPPQETWATTATLVAADVTGTDASTYGRSGAATMTLPAAAQGYNFILTVGTQHNSAFKLLSQSADIYVDKGDGTLLNGKTYVQETNQPVGCQIAVKTFNTGGASSWAWRIQAASATTCTWVTD